MGTALGAKPLGKSKLAQDETNLYLATAKEREIEQQLSETDILKKCKEDNKDVAKAEECIKDKFKNEVDIEEFADRVDLKSFDVKASKNATSMREYLAKRIRKSLKIDTGEPEIKEIRGKYTSRGQITKFNSHRCSRP